MANAKEREKTPFGERLHLATEAEGTSVTRLGRDFGFGPGLHRYVYRGPTGRGAQSLETMSRLIAVANKLHVRLEWLVDGEGPMRREGRGTTPAEQAIVTARGLGTREDAIQQAWEANKEHEKDWSSQDWFEAIELIARRLDRAGIPRPEAIRAQKDAISRQKKKLARKKKGAADETSGAIPMRRRASNEQ